MERELWTALCALAAKFDNWQTPARYTDQLICSVYWWAVIHDRPVVWACDASNWPSELVRRRLPSQPTMSRRLRTAAVERLFSAVEQTFLVVSTVAPLIMAIDGKPLPVGGPSKDADAKATSCTPCGEWGRCRSPGRSRRSMLASRASRPNWSAICPAAATSWAIANTMRTISTTRRLQPTISSWLLSSVLER
jgi:hypothetical protein